MSFPRTLILAESGARAAVVESQVGRGGPYLTCPVSEIVLAPGAAIDHGRLVHEAAGASHIATVAVRQEEGSTFSSHCSVFGGQLVRHDINLELAGEGCDAALSGLCLTTAGQQVDNHLNLRHARPGSTSSQLFKGILDGRSKVVFNGRIVVASDAQKTSAKQSNRNLLLSREARVHSNPQLEIFADDVRCSHGSAVGELDQEAIFYLRSRGIPAAAAERLLTRAFAGEVVQAIKVAPLARAITNLLDARLGGDEPGEEA